MDVKGGATRLKCTNQAQKQVQNQAQNLSQNQMQNLAHNQVQITPQFAPDLEKVRKKCLKQHQPMKLFHFIQKMKKNTLKYGLDEKKDAKKDAKSSFCCSVTSNAGEQWSFFNKEPQHIFTIGKGGLNTGPQCEQEGNNAQRKTTIKRKTQSIQTWRRLQLGINEENIATISEGRTRQYIVLSYQGKNNPLHEWRE